MKQRTFKKASETAMIRFAKRNQLIIESFETMFDGLQIAHTHREGKTMEQSHVVIYWDVEDRQVYYCY